MKSIEFSSNELYFMLHYMKILNKEIDNKYSNSIFEKVKEAFSNQCKEITNESSFKQEYDCQWIVTEDSVEKQANIERQVMDDSYSVRHSLNYSTSKRLDLEW